MESTSQESTRTIGGLSLLRKIAAGGMAEVWEARKEGVGGFSKRMAVKVILPHLTENDEFLKMFVDEGRLASLLDHPNICHIIDLGQEDDVYFMAMEYIDGVVLSALIKEASKRGLYIPFEHCCQAIIGACAGLDYAHDAKDEVGQPLNLVHRDISPQNIMATYDGNIKVVDFGIAKAASQLHHTRAGVLKGKYAYMSPEQATGDPLDRRSDVFALGVVLWEMTTGHRLFRADNEIATLHKILGGDYDPPSAYRDSYPPELELIVMKALAMDRNERFQSCGEMQLALEDFLLRHGIAAGSKRLAYYVRWLLSDEEMPDLSSQSFSGVSIAFESSDPGINTPSGMTPSGISEPSIVSSRGAAPTLPMGDMSLEDFMDKDPSKRRRRRGPGLLIALGLLLFCGAAAAAFFVYRANQTPMNVLRPWVVNSVPRGATIYLNGDKKGKTRSTLYVNVGENYNLRIVKKGYRPFQKFYKQLDNKLLAKQLEIKLEKESVDVRYGFINISVQPNDAVATVDGVKLKGRQMGGMVSFMTRVSAGTSHSLSVEHPKFETHNQNFTVKPDIQKVFEVSLKKKKRTRRRPTWRRRTRTRPRPRPRPRRRPRIVASARRNVVVINPGKLRVLSSPPGAIVKLDGKIIGSTPMGGFVEVEQGKSHTLDIIKENHLTHTQTIKLRSDQKKTVNATLKPTKRDAPTSYVSLSSSPKSTIYVNGKRLGYGSAFSKYPAGRYKVEFRISRFGVSHKQNLFFGKGPQRFHHRFPMGKLSVLSRPIATYRIVGGKYSNRTMTPPVKVPVGRYKLRVTFPNHKTMIKYVTVRKGRITRAKAILR